MSLYPPAVALRDCESSRKGRSFLSASSASFEALSRLFELLRNTRSAGLDSVRFG